MRTCKGMKNVTGARIREARKNRLMTQVELATKLQNRSVNLESGSICRIEAGTRLVTDFELMVFSKVLNVPVEWLLGMQN